MYHPLFCYLSIALTFSCTYLFFRYDALIRQLDGYLLSYDSVYRHFDLFGPYTFSLTDIKYYLPIFLLIFFYTLLSLLKDRQVYMKRSAAQALIKSLGRYIFGGLLLVGVLFFYSTHPTYSKMTIATRLFLKHFLLLYAVCGWPYFYLEEKYRYCRENILADAYVRVMMLGRCLWRWDGPRFRRRLFTKRNRRLLLSWAIRLIYVPVMVEQVCGGTYDLFENFQNVDTRDWVLRISILAWLVDANNASIGYFWQSWFTKTRFKDADPHPSHWIITLACYAPFIDFVSGSISTFPVLAENSLQFFSHPIVNRYIDIILMVILVLYMLSTSSLAFSYSNLGYKKIQTRGPYGLVRHPATACKMMFFTLHFYRFAGAYTWPWFVCYLFWMGIYIGRALVEERFLRRFPEYQAYMKKTRYRFFPGII